MILLHPAVKSSRSGQAAQVNQKAEALGFALELQLGYTRGVRWTARDHAEDSARPEAVLRAHTWTAGLPN